MDQDPPRNPDSYRPPPAELTADPSSTSEQREAVAGPETAASAWMVTSRPERKPRWPLLVAVGFHGALLITQFPASPPIEAEPEPRDRLILVQPPRFEPLEPEKEEIKPPRTRVEPIPDPTPEQPEPLLKDMEIEPRIELPPVDDLLGIPDHPPPPPESTEPMLVMGDVQAPVAIQRTKPRYTEIARRARREGVVVVQAVIDVEGLVVNAKILKPLGFGLDEAALEAAREWRFTPATFHGKPVPVYMNLSVIFSLN